MKRLLPWVLAAVLVVLIILQDHARLAWVGLATGIIVLYTAVVRFRVARRR